MESNRFMTEVITETHDSQLNRNLYENEFSGDTDSLKFEMDN